MIFAEEITILAQPSEVFNVYKKVSDWSVWDPTVESAQIDGDFITGSKGYFKPKSGPKSSITLHTVVQDRSFTVVSKPPFCTFFFEHDIIPQPQCESVLVVHRLRFEGGLGFLFARLIGKSIHKGLPTTLMGLKERCEQRT